MRDEPLERASRGGILQQIREGMPVSDSENQKLGKVVQIYFGTSSDMAEEGGEGTAATVGPDMRGEDSLIEDIAEALAPADELPEELRERLLHYGFIRIDGGILGGDRYATPDQIERVTDDRVTLKVSSDELITR